MSTLLTDVVILRLREAGAGETAVAVTGSCAADVEAVLHREHDTWLLRGLAMGGLFRLVLEVDDAGALDRLASAEALIGALPREGRPRRLAAVGPDHESVLQLMRESMTGDDEQAWVGDRRAGGTRYCEVELRASADLDSDDAVLVGALAKAVLGRRHDSPVMRRIRHERPLAYAVRDSVLDCDGRLELRLRIGGAPATCQERTAAALATAVAPSTPAEHAAALHLVQTRLDTEALGGGEQGAVALDLVERMRRVLAARGTDAACAALAERWRDLSWHVVHEHEGA